MRPLCRHGRRAAGRLKGTAAQVTPVNAAAPTSVTVNPPSGGSCPPVVPRTPVLAAAVVGAHGTGAHPEQRAAVKISLPEQDRAHPCHDDRAPGGACASR